MKNLINLSKVTFREITFNHFHSQSQTSHSTKALDTVNLTILDQWTIRTICKLNGLINKSLITLDSKVFLVNLFLDDVYFHLKQFKLSLIMQYLMDNWQDPWFSFRSPICSHSKPYFSGILICVILRLHCYTILIKDN